MFCEWCGYDFFEVSEFFKGYSIIKEDASLCIGKYCSLNCCIAQIEECGIEVKVRKQKLYELYNLHIDVPPALSPSNLIKKGGNMNYYEYRYNFICPSIETQINGKEEEYYISEEDDYDSY